MRDPFVLKITPSQCGSSEWAYRSLAVAAPASMFLPVAGINGHLLQRLLRSRSTYLRGVGLEVLVVAEPHRLFLRSRFTGVHYPGRCWTPVNFRWVMKSRVANSSISLSAMLVTCSVCLFP